MRGKGSDIYVEIDGKIDDKSMRFRNLRFLDFCEVYNVKLVFFIWSVVPEIDKKSIKNQCKFDARKRVAKIVKNAPKWSQNGSRNRENVDKNQGSKKHWNFDPKRSSPLTPRISLSNLLSVDNLQKKHQQKEQNNIEGCTRWGTSNNECQHARVPAARSGFSGGRGI